MKLLIATPVIHCPTCKEALERVSSTASRVVFSHSSSGNPYSKCDQLGKLFSVEPQTIEASEI